MFVYVCLLYINNIKATGTKKLSQGGTFIAKENEALNARLDELDQRLSELESFMRTKDQELKKISVNEFIRSKNPKNDVERTLAIGYYLENYQSFENFNSSDIKEYFKKSREKIPLNVADKIQLNIKKGHIMNSGEKKDDLKAYILTNKGIDLVEKNFRG